MSWDEWASAEAGAIRAAGRWRAARAFDAWGPEGVLHPGGRRVVSFASNDYLGLTTHPAVRAAAHEAIERWGTGAGAARLVVGSRPVHHDLEAALAAWKGTEAAVVLPSGYAANLAALAAVGGARAGEVRICSDEQNHASIVDGCRLARAEVAVYRHCDLDHLAGLLAGWPGRSVVVSDTVFSMDGDAAPVGDLVELCGRHGALLVLDEAHAVLGPHVPAGAAAGAAAGSGAAAEGGAPVLLVGTLSKTLGAVGGFVAGPRVFVDLVVNRSRPFIFTTAPAPADAAAALAALGVLRSAEGAALVARLSVHVESLRPGHPSPIVPVVLGPEEAALAAAARLLEAGLLVPAIRPPTVPAGTSRLRVTLSAAHTVEQVARLAAAMADLDATLARPA